MAQKDINGHSNALWYNGIVGQAEVTRHLSQWAGGMGFLAQMSRSTLCVPFTIPLAHPYPKGDMNEMVQAYTVR